MTETAEKSSEKGGGSLGEPIQTIEAMGVLGGALFTFHVAEPALELAFGGCVVPGTSRAKWP